MAWNLKKAFGSNWSIVNCMVTTGLSKVGEKFYLSFEFLRKIVY